LGFVRRRDECLSVRAGIEIFAGHHGRVDGWLRVVEASASKRGDPHLLSWALLQRLECIVLREAVDEGYALLDRLRPLHGSIGRPERIWALGLEAHLLSVGGDHVGASACADQAEALVAVGPPVHCHCIDAYARLAETRIALFLAHPPGTSDGERYRGARRACLTLRKAARIFPIARPMAALHSGALDLARGRIKRAHAGWRAGIEVAKQLLLPYHEARLHHALARSLPPSDPWQAHHARQAELLEDQLALSDSWSRARIEALAVARTAASGGRVQVERELH
jgi:hypothetical protein